MLLSTLPFDGMAYEPYVLQPSTRAASMAGVFSPQADDSSAIWYNPAGLKRAESISSEVSIDYAQQATRSVIKPTATTSEMSEYGEEMNGLRFAAGYIDRLPFLTKSNDRWGTGIAYFTLSRLTINVDEPQSDINSDPFGLVTAVNRQVSWLIGVSLTSKLSFGGTIDYVWSDIDCLEFSPCVDNDPAGAGGSLGAVAGRAGYSSSKYNFGFAARKRKCKNQRYVAIQGRYRLRFNAKLRYWHCIGAVHS